MAWVPDNQVFDLTPVVDNLLAYIGTNDDDALTWASGATGLPGFKGLYPNASGRLATLFPQIIVLDQECEVSGKGNEGEVLIGNLALTLEGALTGKNADTLALLTKTYALALESMLVNIPTETLMAGMNVEVSTITPMGYQTAFDQVKGQGGKQASSWLQIFQTRVSYMLVGRAT